MWAVPISFVCVPRNCLLLLFCLILSLHLHLLKYEMIRDQSPLNQNVLKVEETTGRAKLLIYSGWIHWDGVLESKFNQLFHKLPDPLSSALGSRTWIQRTTVQPWQAAYCQDGMEWNGMEWHLGADSYFWQVIKRRENQKTDPKSIPKFTNVNIFCLCLEEKKPETLRPHEIISAQNHSSHVFFNGNFNINYCLHSFAVIFYRSEAMYRTNIH